MAQRLLATAEASAPRFDRLLAPGPRRWRRHPPVWALGRARPASRRSSAKGTFVVALLLFATSACSRQQLGLPRVHLAVDSPDGGRTALVRNHPDIDPPSQSLWLRTADGKQVRLRKLIADLDWCNTIVWSADSSVVAFLVQDARLVVAASREPRVVLEQWLVDAPRGYPPRQVVRDLALSADGSMASYRRCPRKGGGCSQPETLELPG